MSDAAIKVEGLWKRYGLPLPSVVRAAGNGVRRGLGRRPKADVFSLRDISFELAAGQSLGVIGRNGAGKSTLLKILAGVTPPTYGRVEVHGRLFPMIELQAGIHPELTGRENMRLLAAIAGLSRAETRARMPAAEEFSELGEWLDRPIRTYSTGMLARLGFSVAMNVDADILLVDEVLAVGDAPFQKKCLAEIDRARHRGTTIIFVSHSPYAVERVCDAAMLLRSGSMASSGSPTEIMAAYSAEIADAPRLPDRSSPREGSGEVRVLDVQLLDSVTGTRVGGGAVGQPLTLRALYEAREALASPRVAFRLYDVIGTLVANLQASPQVRRDLVLSGTGAFDCSIGGLPIAPGSYEVEVIIKDGLRTVDKLRRAATLTVATSAEYTWESGDLGLVYVQAEWSFPRTLEAAKAPDKASPAG
jgi:lipopolysaccharide transport system ATP-binding protein